MFFECSHFHQPFRHFKRRIKNILLEIPSMCVSLCPSVRPSVRRSACLSVRLSVCVSLCLSLSPCRLFALSFNALEGREIFANDLLGWGLTAMSFVLPRCPIPFLGFNLRHLLTTYSTNVIWLWTQRRKKQCFGWTKSTPLIHTAPEWQEVSKPGTFSEFQEKLGRNAQKESPF